MDAAEARLLSDVLWAAFVRCEEVVQSASDDQAMHAFKKTCVDW